MMIQNRIIIILLTCITVAALPACETRPALIGFDKPPQIKNPDSVAIYKSCKRYQTFGSRDSSAQLCRISIESALTGLNQALFPLEIIIAHGDPETIKTCEPILESFKQVHKCQDSETSPLLLYATGKHTESIAAFVKEIENSDRALSLTVPALFSQNFFECIDKPTTPAQDQKKAK